MIEYPFPSTTFSDAVSDTAPDTAFGIEGAPAEAILSFVLVSDQPFNFRINTDATTDDAYVPASTPVRVTIYGTDTISYISATDADQGTIFITRVS